MSEAKKTDLLVLSVHPPELRGIRTIIGETLAGEVNGMSIVAKPVGVGMPIAGPSAMRRILQFSPKAVLLVGTCGVYPGLPNYYPHDVIVAQKMKLLDHGVLSGLAAFPGPVQTEIVTDSALTTGIVAHAPRGRIVPVSSTLAPTRDDTIANVIAQQSQAHVEVPEAFSIASACHLTEIPFACVLSISHVCGSTGAIDWPKFERQSSLAIGEVLLRWLQSGAAGFPQYA